MLVFATVFATILCSVKASATVCGASPQKCMDSPDLTDTTIHHIAAAQFLSYAVYGDDEMGEKYEKLYSICGRLDEHEKIKYPFDVGADPITDKKQGCFAKGQLQKYSASVLAQMEIKYSNVMCDVSNAIIVIPKFDGNHFLGPDERPICAVAFRGSSAAGEFVADISRTKGWIVLGDDWQKKKDITIVHKGASETYQNEKYLRTSNDLFDRFKHFVDTEPNSKAKEKTQRDIDYKRIYRKGKKAMINGETADIEDKDGLQTILSEYMNNDAGKGPKCSKKVVWVTGHSLGGAFSTFFSLGLKYGIMEPQHMADNYDNRGFAWKFSRAADVVALQGSDGAMGKMKYQTMHSLSNLLKATTGEGPKVKTITNNGLPIFARDPKYKTYMCPPNDWGAGLYRTITTSWDRQVYDGLGTITNIAGFGAARASQMYYCSEAWSMDYNTMGNKRERGGLPQGQGVVKQGLGFPFDPQRGSRNSRWQHKVHKQPSVGCGYPYYNALTGTNREWKGTPGAFRGFGGALNIHGGIQQPMIWAWKASLVKVGENGLTDLNMADAMKWCDASSRSMSSRVFGTESELSHPGYSEDKVGAAFQDQSTYRIMPIMVSFMAGLIVAKMCSWKGQNTINFQSSLLENEI